MCVQLGMLAERIMLFLYVCVSVVVCCALMEVVVFLSFLLSACVILDTLCPYSAPPRSALEVRCQMDQAIGLMCHQYPSVYRDPQNNCVPLTMSKSCFILDILCIT